MGLKQEVRLRSGWFWSGASVGLAFTLLLPLWSPLSPTAYWLVALALPAFMTLPDAAVCLWARVRHARLGSIQRLFYLPIWIEFWLGYALGGLSAIVVALTAGLHVFS